MTTGEFGQIGNLKSQEEDESRVPPAHTPGQAEGENGDVDPDAPREEPIRRRRPSQAEGEDPEDQADDAPKDE